MFVPKSTLSHLTIGIHSIALFGLTFRGRSKVTSKSLETISIRFRNSLKQIDTSYDRSHCTDECFVEMEPVTQILNHLCVQNQKVVNVNVHVGIVGQQ